MAKRRRTLAGVTPTPPRPNGDELNVALPDGNSLTIGFKPMPPNALSQRVQMTAVFRSNADTMGEAVESLSKFQQAEPHDALGPIAARVVARTAAAPLSFRSVAVWERDAQGARQRGTPEAPVTSLTPPNETFVVRFSEQDSFLRFDRLWSTAERIRNLVAFGVGQSVPMAVQLASRGLLHPISFQAEPPTNVPREVVEGDRAATEKWYDGYRMGYSAARRALSELPPSGPESRALSLVGEAMWSGDVEERFFYCWRALEVVGNLQLKQARDRLRDGETAPAEPYLKNAAEALLNGQPARIDAPLRVKIAVGGRFPQFPISRVDEFYEWRNAIAHGDVAAEQHLGILKAGPEIFALAYETARPLLPT